MKTILVPTDFSAAAANAAEYAVHLSKDLKATVILLHVYHFPTSVSEVPIMVVTPEELEKQNNALLKKEAARIKKKTGAEVKYMAKPGLAVDEIIEEGKKAALTVMGMRGAGKMGEALLGSITTTTLRKIQNPLLVIPDNASYKKPEVIVFATDYDPKINLQTIDTLKEFRNIFHSKIYVVNVKQKKESVAVKEVFSDTLENKLNDTEHVYYFAEKEDLAENINEFAKNHHADIIAIIPHHYNLMERLFHRSVSRKMAFHSSIPLLALPDL